MKIKKGKVRNQQLVITLTVDDEEIEKHLQRASVKLSSRLKIPGFRKGKAPRSIVEQLVGRDGLVEESLDEAVPDVVHKAIEEENIEVFSTPKVSKIDLQPKMTIEAVLALKPMIQLSNISGIKVKIEKEKITAKEVNKVIDQIRDQNGSWVPVKRPTKMGDLLTVDFKCEVGDKIILDHSAIDLLLDVQFEDNLKMPGLMKKMTGILMEKSKAFSIVLPTDYPEEDLREKKANFVVLIHEIKEKNLPNVDDSLANTIDPSVKDLKELKKKIKINLEQSAEKKWEQLFWDDYLKQIVNSSNYTVADLMVEQETDLLLSQQKKMIENQKIEFAEYLKQINKSEEDFIAELKEAADIRIKRSLTIDELLVHYEINVEEDKVREDLDKWKNQQGNTKVSEEQIMDEIRYSLKREKLLSQIIDNQKKSS
ncbi:MAG: trigger factor [Dehalococcoidia bacterium]|nr:trigger factor [Dehalococcoidia bacterium]